MTNLVRWKAEAQADTQVGEKLLDVGIKVESVAHRNIVTATAGIRMPRMHPHMLRHTFVTTMLDAGVSLRDVQIAARHADPRTTMRYDRDERTA